MTEMGPAVVANTPETYMGASLERAGKNSYYYAWSGGVPHTPTVHTPIAKTKIEAEEKPPTAITTYSWLDDDAVVKIYVSMDGIGDLPSDNIKVEYTPRSVVVDILDFNGTNYRFVLRELKHDVEPDACSLRQRPNKLIITLKKVDSEEKWYDLLNKS